MIEPPPVAPTLQEAAEWIIRALQDEGFPILICGKSALDYQGEYTRSVDVDILIGTDFRGALSVLDVYVNRGDLDPAGAVSGSVARYLVSGNVAVDVMSVSSIRADLFSLLSRETSVGVRMDTAGEVHAITREGYFVLAVMIGRKGFAKEKEDPMLKVRQGWALFGPRTDRTKVDKLLQRLGVQDGLEGALREP
jgi:hypothetical protein